MGGVNMPDLKALSVARALVRRPSRSTETPGLVRDIQQVILSKIRGVSFRTHKFYAHSALNCGSEERLPYTVKPADPTQC